MEDYLTESKIIDDVNGIDIHVYNERNHGSTIPYFVATMVQSNKEIRCHIKDNGVEIHNKKRNKGIWKITRSDSKNIHDLMNMQCEAHMAEKARVICTNWEFTCFEWNALNGIMPNDENGLKNYLNGYYDRFCTGYQYVPSTTSMPNYWEYHKKLSPGDLDLGILDEIIDDDEE